MEEKEIECEVPPTAKTTDEPTTEIASDRAEPPSPSDIISGDDGQVELESLQAENRKMQNEFNSQRAKLKELFMQKETEYSKCKSERQALQRELDDLKSQFFVADLKSENEMRLKDMKAQQEITSLQQLIQDTLEELGACKAELDRVKEGGKQMWQENCELREQLQQQQQQPQHHQHQQHEAAPTGLAPQMLSQVKKTLARTLGGDSSSSSMLGSSFHQDSIDDSSRSKSKFSHEDPEVLCSIVVQLQEEMKALKEKLREADVKLQGSSAAVANSATNRLEQALLSKSTSMDATSSASASASAPAFTASCDTCPSYQLKVQQLLTKGTEDEQEIESLQRSVAESREDLQKEAALRKDLEDQWQTKREAHKAEVQMLREQVKRNEQQLLELQQKFLETKDECVRQLQRISDDRERVNKHLETLQADNDYLSGRYLATAEEIENQYINLPNTVDELHVLMLRQQNDLIQARVGSEFERQKCVTSLDEIQILRDQLDASNNERRVYKKKVQTEIKSLQDRLTEHLLTLQNYETIKTTLERKEVELNRQISQFRVEIIELQDANEKLSKNNSEYKLKIKNLQEDIANGEQVQKDFVQLSQRLQMSLEELRRSDTEVRWQDDDDVDNCPTCNASFTVTLRRIHCRHCGHIYCDKCLTKTVPSGARKRNARVCDICHTLLTPNTAPYFSHEPLQPN